MNANGWKKIAAKLLAGLLILLVCLLIKDHMNRTRAEALMNGLRARVAKANLVGSPPSSVSRFLDLENIDHSEFDKEDKAGDRTIEAKVADVANCVFPPEVLDVRMSFQFDKRVRLESYNIWLGGASF